MLFVWLKCLYLKKNVHLAYTYVNGLRHSSVPFLLCQCEGFLYFQHADQRAAISPVQTLALRGYQGGPLHAFPFRGQKCKHQPKSRLFEHFMQIYD